MLMFAVYLNDIQNLAYTSEATHYVSITKAKQLILCKEMITLYSENHTKPINTLCGKGQCS